MNQIQNGTSASLSPQIAQKKRDCAKNSASFKEWRLILRAPVQSTFLINAGTAASRFHQTSERISGGGRSSENLKPDGGGLRWGAGASAWRAPPCAPAGPQEARLALSPLGSVIRTGTPTQARPPDQGLIFRLSNKSWQRRLLRGSRRRLICCQIELRSICFPRSPARIQLSFSSRETAKWPNGGSSRALASVFPCLASRKRCAQAAV